MAEVDRSRRAAARRQSERCSSCRGTSRSTPARGGWRTSRPLDEGPGFVVLDRLPLDRINRPEAVDLYWLLGDLLGRRWRRSEKGTVIFDVATTASRSPDTRGALTPAPGSDARRQRHGRARADYVSLMCLATTRSGGISVVSSASPPTACPSPRAARAAPAALRAVLRDRPEYQAADAAATNFRPSSPGTASSARASTPATRSGATRRPGAYWTRPAPRP